MISFACSHCHQNVTVKDDFAGRTAKCPGCKQPLTVPARENLATHPVGGTPAEAGVEGRILLDQAAATPGQAPIHKLLEQRNSAGRYQIGGQIARGGMGAVMRAVDCDLRREVAVKFMLDQADPRKKQRFVEEAQITGQLEHPNIVPIHELGLDAQKRLFFAMKMVKGRSLAEVLNIHRDEPKKAEKDWSLGRLLGIFVNICHALAYAHSRGVIHRDLKPANIMVGDFGEVYVMDWGLAKVLHGGGQLAETLSLPVENGASAQVTKVVTERGPEANLTQEGSVLGTPMYMPPEQAAGQLQDINERSDVYSLGAILYEMLTLEPPVEPEGGPMGVLMQVLQGQVVPPEQRTPARAMAGQIPRELSAVAMKALAKEPKVRYASAEDLRKDIERFQEGRSVSAKVDSNWELIWKLVKRNKGASVGAVATFFVVLVSIVIIFQAWRETQASNTSLAKKQAEKDQADKEKVKAEQEKRKQMVESVPTILEAARYFVNQREFKTAADQVKVALEYDPTNADTHLLKAQLLMGEKKFDTAQTELAVSLRLRPQHPEGRAIAGILQKGKPEDAWVVFELSDELSRQQLHGLAAVILESAGDLLEARKRLVPRYKKKIEEAWNGLGDRLSIDDKGRISLDLKSCKQVVDLVPLQGMQINSLKLFDCGPIREISPLKGMPLISLLLGPNEEVSDLTPLQGSPLSSLHLHCCSKLRDLTTLQGLSLNSLTLAGMAIGDLRPLKGMPLKEVSLDAMHDITDLSPLQGMSLTVLSMHNCGGISDLSPIKGMKLVTLVIGSGRVKDLTPLEGMSLKEIRFDAANASKSNLRFLREMKSLASINQMAAAEFWKKYDSGDFK